MKKNLIPVLFSLFALVLASAFTARHNQLNALQTDYYFFLPDDQSEPVANIEHTTLLEAESTFCDGADAECRDYYNENQVNISNGIATASGSPVGTLQKAP